MRTRQWLQSILLLLLGLYFLQNLLTGRVYFYINERFGWLSGIAAAIFVALGVVGVADLLRARRVAHAHGDEEHDGPAHHHEHTHADHQHGAGPSWAVLLIIALPLALGVLAPAKPLGASAVGSSGVSTSFSTVQGSGTTTRFNVSPTERNILDWVRVFNSTANVDEFSGQQADLVGFVYRDIRFNDETHFMVARFTVSCCVADASAIGVIVQSPDGTKLAQDSWVHVKGKFQVKDFDGQRTPILLADSVELTNQPEHPYLYP